MAKKTLPCLNVMVVLLVLVNQVALADESSAWLAQVEDPSLRACVASTSAEQGWRSPLEVRTLKCHSMAIQSLSGLAQFSALESLSLYNNQISELGSELDSMQSLDTLNLARNRIKTISLAGLASLSKLYLFDNGAELLSLKTLPRLSLLKAQNNRLASFEYHGTPALEKIYIFNNVLEHIDIYNLPVLGYMDCRQNPMPDLLYDEMDKQEDVVYLHDGNAEDWN